MAGPSRPSRRAGRQRQVASAFSTGGGGFLFETGQTCRDPSAYDALNLSQWEFSVVKGQAVTDYGTRTAGLGFVREHSGGPVGYHDLATAIRAAHHGP